MKRSYLSISLLFLSVPVFSQNFVAAQKENDAIAIVSSRVASIYVEDNDDWLAGRSASLLQDDIERVTGKKPAIVKEISALSGNTIIIGTIHGCSLIRSLLDKKKIALAAIDGKWEAFQLQTVVQPFKGVPNALVIAGNDKRGTAYGVLELSRQMGVSPWYWWADVPVKKKKEIYIRKGVYRYAPPSVKYRGIFINDEAPAFSRWTKEKFGGVNHLVYEKMFELLLRLKANYLWPAMWGNAFNDDDPLNPVLADKWGIVMGTSHHEPMLRAQQEWKRYGKGAWDYTINDTILKDFWRKGIENMGHHESIVTIGMRGDGDKPMTQGTAIDLLERIVTDQRKIIAEVTGKPAGQTPQLWALYKEVQDYYDQGMRVPDDVTLLLCDDNWGNIRRLPDPADKPRPGGYGIYYHFDYVGGPRNYKWINTNNISRVWEQMHLACEYGVDKIWIVNVGDLKPMEFPISFFLDYAYDTKKWTEKNLTGYYRQWAQEQFGAAKATEIGGILQKYALYASRRKPELLDDKTYSLDNGEFDRVLEEWVRLRRQAEKVEGTIPPEYKDAYFELVLHPIQAMENLHQLYYAVAMNKRHAAKKNVLANSWADSAARFYLADSLLSIRYNKDLAGGKWDHMMDQVHIGYTGWQEPARNRMPALVRVDPDPAVSTRDVRNNTSTGKDGTISIDAVHYTRMINSTAVHWTVIPDIGKYGDGITTFPVTTHVPLSSTSPHLEYEFSTSGKDPFNVLAFFSPTLNFRHSPDGLQFAISIDQETPKIIGLNKEDNTGVWNSWVANQVIIKTTRHSVLSPGKHVLRYWMIDPGVILQRLVIDTTTAAATAAGGIPSLKEAFKGDFAIGTALSIQQIEEKDSGAAVLIPKQFNTVTPENIMKAVIIHPEWGRYNFEPADKLVAYGLKYGIRINAHNLIWHSQLPSFVRRMKDPDSVKRYFIDHITTVAARYDGKVYSWDVVNEALNEDGTLRKSIFLTSLGEDYIVEAFRLAQQAAPHTKLYYNDYNIEAPRKRAGAIALVKKIQAAGVRIDGIGIQGHWKAATVPLEDIEQSIKEFSALGIEVMFTELDLSVLPNPFNGNTADVNRTVSATENMDPYKNGLPDSVQSVLTKGYADLFTLFLKYSGKISRVTFWGVNDGQSWLNNWPIRGRTNYPLLFDRQFKPKPAFYKIMEIKEKTK